VTEPSRVPESLEQPLDQFLVAPVLGFVEELVEGLTAPPRTLAASPWALARLPVAAALTGGRHGAEHASRVPLQMWMGFLEAFPAAGHVPSDPPPGVLGAGVLRSRVGVDRSVLEAFFARLVVPRGPQAATAYCVALLRLARAVDALLRGIDPPAWPVEQVLEDLRAIMRERLGRTNESGHWRARVSRTDGRFDDWSVPRLSPPLASPHGGDIGGPSGHE